MPPVIHRFKDSLARGKASEAVLDVYFSQWYTIETIPLELELTIHADRLFIRPDGSQVLVEYKADSRAASSGCLFIELVANDVTNTPGWAYNSKADFLAFLVPQTGLVMVAPLPLLRTMLTGWTKRFPQATAANPEYNSRGLIVPVKEFMNLCDWVDNVTE